MKKIYIICLAALTLGSCQEVLDLEPTDSLSDAAFWSNENTIQGYVDRAYQVLGGYHATRVATPRIMTWGHFRGEATDEAYAHIVWGGGQDLTNGRLNPDTQETIGGWRYSYPILYHINVFFENYENGRIDVPEDKLAVWLGEMHFLRAWYHNQMIKAYGGVVIADRAFTPDDPVDQVRASYDECVDFILDEIDLALVGLPDEAEAGRVTSGAAMGLKAQVLLHAASPLHNPSNDQAKWQAAADANLDVIELEQYSLYGMPGSGVDFHDIWYDTPSEGNTELMMARYENNDGPLHHFFNYSSTLFGVPSWGGWGLATPTGNFADAFQMADGTSYDSTMYGQNPYENRELRFYETILYDGAPFSVTMPRVPPIEQIGNKIESGTYTEFDSDGNVITRPGYDRQGGVLQETKNFTRTGYYAHKHVRDDHTSKFQIGDVTQCPFMRLTEFYLNYAECLVMLGRGAEAREYVLPIRQRALLPDESLPATLTMDDIMHERRIELAYEDHRFFDVRRWKILDQTFVDVYKVDVHTDRTVDPEVKTYKYSLLQERVFDEKLYYMPIPQSEINKNPLLEQNPGY